MKILKENLDGIAKLLRKDWDWLHVVTGYEGVGKSSLAMQMCIAIDPSFNIGSICFTADEFMRAVDRAKKYQAILADEGSEFLLSRDAMKRENRDAVKLFTQMRSKNLFIVICIPNIMILDSYVREHRIRSMTRVVRRGAFEFYSGKLCKMIKKDGKTRQIIYPQTNFFDGFPILKGKLWNEYLAKKRAFRRRVKNPFFFKQLDIYHAKIEKSLTLVQIAKICNVKTKTVHAWRSKYNLFAKKYTFIDASGRIRITNAGFKGGMAKLKRIRLKQQRGRPKKRKGMKYKKKHKRRV